MRTINDLLILNDIDDYLEFLNDMGDGCYWRSEYDDRVYYATEFDDDGVALDARDVTSSILLDVAHAVVKTVNKLI